MTEATKLLYKEHRKLKSDYKPFNTKTKGLQFDLIDISNITRYKIVKPYKYILTIIEQNSRYARAIPIKNKTANSVYLGFNNVFNDIITKIPDIVNARSDDGNEFNSPKLMKLFKDNNITYKKINTSIFSKTSLALIERFNKTIMYSIIPLVKKSQHSLTEIIDEFIEEYNNRKHTTTKCAPNDIINGKCTPITEKDTNYSGPYDVGTFVLRSIPKEDFSKRKMTYFPNPYLIDFVDDSSGKHHLLDLITTQDYPILLPKYELKKITKGQVKELTENNKDLMKMYNREMKYKNKDKLVRQQKHDFDTNHEVKDIDSNGNVIYKDRLQPKTTKEGRRIVAKR